MLARARAQGIYEQLTQQDVAHHMGGTERRYDLIAAADVFTDVGDPMRCSRRGAGARQGWRVCFAVEAADDAGADLVLRGSLRYAHSRLTSSA